MPIVPVTDARKYLSKPSCFGVTGQLFTVLWSKTGRQATRLPQPGTSKSSLGNVGERTFLLFCSHPTPLLATGVLGVGPGCDSVSGRSAGAVTLAALCSPAP